MRLLRYSKLLMRIKYYFGKIALIFIEEEYI